MRSAAELSPRQAEILFRNAVPASVSTDSAVIVFRQSGC
jgi:hypothetical protein